MSDENNDFYYQGGRFSDSGVTKVVIATGVTKIDDSAFEYCEELQSVVFEEPHQVKEIGRYAFHGCHELESIELPETLHKIRRDAFHCCRALRKLVIPGGVTSIGGGAFGYSGIEEIVISDGVKSIPKYAFQSCPRLHTARLPASLQEIHTAAFHRCMNLANVIVPADGLPFLKRLDLCGHYELRGWEAMCNMAQKVPNLISLSLSGIKIGAEYRMLVDDGILLVIEMVSSCPPLESLDLSYNAFSDQAIRTLDSQGILAQLRVVEFRRNSGTGSLLPSNEFLDLLKKNPRLVIWTDHEWEQSKDERLIRHYLDMNRFGCRGVPITNVSTWPRLIHRLRRIHRRLKTSFANVLYHLLREQNNGLCLYDQRNHPTKKWHPDCEKGISTLKQYQWIKNNIDDK